MQHALHPATLARRPELATLALLETLLSLTHRVLIAEHPTLLHEEQPYWTELPTADAARRVLSCAEPLRAALEDYRAAALDALTPVDGHIDIDDSDLPF